MECSGRCSDWCSLTTELVERVTSLLPLNEVACNLRLLDRSTAKQLQAWNSVRLSQPVPTHAFVRRWGHEHDVRDLTLNQRQQLLCLTARSGILSNLQVAVAAAGCPLPGWEASGAAAAGGNVDVCAWVRDRAGAEWDSSLIESAAEAGHRAVVHWALRQDPNPNTRAAHAGTALETAASAGHQALCEELLAAEGLGPIPTEAAVTRAAARGHVGLTHWLLGQLPHQRRRPPNVLPPLLFASYGFALPELQRLYHSMLGDQRAASPLEQQQQQQRWQQAFQQDHGPDLALAALFSPTPDWRAKLEWLEASTGCSLAGRRQELHSCTGHGCSKPPPSEGFDAPERLEVLRGRGALKARDVDGCLHEAVKTGSLRVVRHLLARGGVGAAAPNGQPWTEIAAERGHVAVLGELLEAGCPMGRGAIRKAARFGHLRVLQFLDNRRSEAAGPAAALWAAVEGSELAVWGAASGSLELMEWLWGPAGCPCDEEVVFEAAAVAGCGTLLERLVERGCSMGAGAYLAAGRNADMATLRCLRRLGCPWDPDPAAGGTFSRAVYDEQVLDRSCRLEVLRWLVDEGCPVDWRAAAAAAAMRMEAVQQRRVWRDADAAAVQVWIEGHIAAA